MKTRYSFLDTNNPLICEADWVFTFNKCQEYLIVKKVVTLLIPVRYYMMSCRSINSVISKAKLGSKMEKDLDLNPKTKCPIIHDIVFVKVVGKSEQSFSTVFNQIYHEYNNTIARQMG